ncbi:unnamed protein product [Porites lobata]|uniref:Transposase n=1 Tax=Porites lobata TaxID=104759 RepID=A0ABN8PSL3_9CNID|nr:unnamed protein product [Porites lobata]
MIRKPNSIIDVFPDNATGRKILSVVIKCPSDGCSWTGELRDKEVKLAKTKIISKARWIT